MHNENEGSPDEKSSLGDVLLERGKHRDEDIGDIWREQKRIREEESLLELEYRQAKQKAKAIKAKMKEQQKIEEAPLIGELKRHAPNAELQPEKLLEAAKKAYRPIQLSVVGLFIRFIKPVASRRKTLALAVLVVASVMIMFIAKPFGSSGRDKSKDASATATLGEAVSTGTGDLEGVQDTEFELIYPNSVNPSNVKVVRVNPDNAATVYAYVDKLDDAQLRISQQVVPENFKPSVDTSLKDLAESFNLNYIIQIDDTKVYHGFNDKDNTQALMFVKENLLVLIASSQKLSDDTWASYIATMR